MPLCCRASAGRTNMVGGTGQQQHYCKPKNVFRQRASQPQHCRHNAAQLLVVCRGSRGPSEGGPRLILPGQTRMGGRGGGLIIPGQNDKPSGQVNNFRPPPGFMDTPEEEAARVKKDPNEMLSALRSRSAHWHELAKYILGLQRTGKDGPALEELTGIERALQNIWVVSSQVYDSLKKSGEVPEEALAYFDNEGGEHLLYDMRFLPVERRPATARYIAERRLDAVEAATVARAVREQERRQGHKLGFSVHPGDCMAFKWYRDTFETKSTEAKAMYIANGLAAAVTPAARAKMQALKQEEEAPEAEPASTATMTLVRMTPEEVGLRPVPIIGDLIGVDAAAVAAAPSATTSGAFTAFRVFGEPGQQWLCLPAWNMIIYAHRPVAISIPNCAQVPAIVASAAAKTEDEKKKLMGPGLLVIDRKAGEISADKFYLVKLGANNVDIVSGDKILNDSIAGDDVCGLCVLCCRPPAREAGSASETSELIQV